MGGMKCMIGCHWKCGSGYESTKWSADMIGATSEKMNEFVIECHLEV